MLNGSSVLVICMRTTLTKVRYALAVRTAHTAVPYSPRIQISVYLGKIMHCMTLDSAWNGTTKDLESYIVGNNCPLHHVESHRRAVWEAGYNIEVIAASPILSSKSWSVRTPRSTSPCFERRRRVKVVTVKKIVTSGEWSENNLPLM